MGLTTRSKGSGGRTGTVRRDTSVESGVVALGIHNKTPIILPGKYSNETKTLAYALYAAGYTMTQIEAHIKVPPTTIANWVHNPMYRDSLLVKEVSDEVSASLAATLILHANRMAAKETEDERMDKMSSFQLNIMKKNNMELARLLRGESTENVAVVTKHIEVTKSRITEEREELLRKEKELSELNQRISADDL